MKTILNENAIEKGIREMRKWESAFLEKYSKDLEGAIIKSIEKMGIVFKEYDHFAEYVRDNGKAVVMQRHIGDSKTIYYINGKPILEAEIKGNYFVENPKVSYTITYL
jgi:hypothetical protein